MQYHNRPEAASRREQAKGLRRIAASRKKGRLKALPRGHPGHDGLPHEQAKGLLAQFFAAYIWIA